MSDCVAAACKYIYKNILCGATRERESSGLGKAEVSSSPVQSERWFFFFTSVYISTYVVFGKLCARV